jgi:hypothetical protein
MGLLILVPRAGLEPARLAAGDFESPASTCFTTWACLATHAHRAARGGKRRLCLKMPRRASCLPTIAVPAVSAFPDRTGRRAARGQSLWPGLAHTAPHEPQTVRENRSMACCPRYRSNTIAMLRTSMRPAINTSSLPAPIDTSPSSAKLRSRSSSGANVSTN